MNIRPRREPTVFAPDTRPGADTFVYCKGCGHALEGEPRLAGYRAKITVMMCEDCRQTHGHQLVPSTGAPSFCYRCGGRDEIFVERGTYPSIHHMCPRCTPDRVAHFRRGSFKAAPAEPVVPAATQ